MARPLPIPERDIEMLEGHHRRITLALALAALGGLLATWPIQLTLG